LLIVDYLQLMSSAGTSENRVQEVSQISRSLKILARDLEVPILALSQLSRAVEQRTDKRPILSDLRESGCLAGDTRVYLPDEGVYRPIRDLEGHSGFRVLAVDTESWRLEPRTVTHAFSTGRKPVFRLRTRLGREIRATANHKFLAFDGWRRLDDLAPGMRLATPRERLLNRLAKQGSRNLNRDVIPREAWRTLVRPAMRERAVRVAAAVASPELANLATSDVYWDEILTIEPDGRDDVYDLTVDGLHNFVAEDMSVHNSIEQDADLVAFIYRDEYYNDESDQQGLAEVILAKHRNGPTDAMKLSFLKRYAKFADLAAQ
jgi:replicative DNA helicase